MIDFKKLKAFFPPDKVSWRVGSIAKSTFDPEKGGKATALAYIDARDVMERLDEVCGPENWADDYPHANSKTVCTIGINVNQVPNLAEECWVWKADGAGDSDIEAEKGALSDAFKRAAVRWGIGRYLYDMPAPWVAIDKWKKILPHEMEKLHSLLPNAPANSVKVIGVTGLSKKPAGFWGFDNLLLTLKKYEADPIALQNWRIDEFKRGVDKAPTRDLLAKFQTDNHEWIDKLDATLTHQLYESCAIRAEQFDQLNGG